MNGSIEVFGSGERLGGRDDAASVAGAPGDPIVSGGFDKAAAEFLPMQDGEWQLSYTAISPATNKRWRLNAWIEATRTLADEVT